MSNRIVPIARRIPTMTKVVITVEFETEDPENDSRLMLECVNDGIPSYFEEKFNVRYKTTTHPEE